LERTGQIKFGSQLPRLVSIDVLRACAALWVLFSHIRHRAFQQVVDLRLLLTIPLDLEDSGVRLFLVISGFCIHLRAATSLAHKKECRVSWLDFWKRRFFRLYPPYLAAMALSLSICAVLAWAGSPDRDAILWWPRDIAVHLLMLQNVMHETGRLGNYPFWTLGLEEQLYALYALFLLLRRRRGLWNTVWLTLGISVVFGFVAYWLAADNVALGTGPFALGAFPAWPLVFWFNWVVGAAAAECHTRASQPYRWQASVRVAVIWGIIGFALSRQTFGRIITSHALAPYLGSWSKSLHSLTVLSPLAFGFCFFVLVTWCVQREVKMQFDGPWLRRLAAIGVMSYSLYLVQMPVLNVLHHIVPLGDSVGETVLRYLLFTPPCIGAAYLFFRLVEARFLFRKRASLQERKLQDSTSRVDVAGQ
jgi:peptidoglycan/LPS O-acetylase OafA/YrhL